MTVMMPFGRVLTRQFLPRSNHLLTRLASSNSILRTSGCESGSTSSSNTGRTPYDGKSISLSVRGYATEAAKKPASRPKAHTGRTAARKTTTKSKSTATKKPSAKPKTRAKPKAKPRAKPKPKKRIAKSAPSKTALNRVRIAKTKELKTRALLTAPKQLPANAWTVYFSQEHKGAGSTSVTEGAAKTKEIAQKFKTLSPEEQERLNHTANQNKAKNEAEYKKWVSQYTPAEIKDANNARKALSKEAKVKEGKKRAPVHLIKDDRLVKQSKNAYTYFVQERFASNDFRHMALREASRLIGREWKALNASEKKTYEDQAKADAERYNEEYQTVYGKPPNYKNKKSTTST